MLPIVAKFSCTSTRLGSSIYEGEQRLSWELPWISKPSERSFKKFIRGGSVPSAAVSIERPAENQLSTTIVLGSHAPEPMVNERGLPDPSPGNDRNDVLPDRLRSSNSPPRMSEDENENDSQISKFGSTAFIEFRSNLYSG